MKNWVLLACTITLSACGGSAEPVAVENSLTEAATYINKNGAAVLPEAMAQATVGATVEGKDTIVIQLANLPTGNATLDSNFARKMLRPKVCEDTNTRALIEAGGKIRFEMKSNTGKEALSAQIARCD